MRSTLWSERNSRRRPHEEKARILVASVVQRVQAPADESVVDRSNRKQASVVQRGAKAQRGECKKKIVLGNSKFDVLTFGREYPLLHRPHFCRSEIIGGGATAENSAAVH